MTSKIRNEWYQTDTEVVVSVFIKNVQQDKLAVDLQEKSVSLTVTLPSGTDVVFDLDPLAHAIDVAQSSYKVSTVKIEFKLRKKQSGIKWSALEGSDDDVVVGTMIQPSLDTKRPSYPTSAKKRTNWDDVVKADAEDDEELLKSKDKNASGDADVSKLFQTLYADATDEQKKAMIKSYQESNGTALSTDWSTVKAGKVETSPPDSMIARKWGGNPGSKAFGNNVL